MLCSGSPPNLVARRRAKSREALREPRAHLLAAVLHHQLAGRILFRGVRQLEHVVVLAAEGRLLAVVDRVLAVLRQALSESHTSDLHCVRLGRCPSAKVVVQNFADDLVDCSAPRCASAFLRRVGQGALHKSLTPALARRLSNVSGAICRPCIVIALRRCFGRSDWLLACGACHRSESLCALEHTSAH